MLTYWCPWCGATAEAPGLDQRLPCRRCSSEFRAVLGFGVRTDMVPLRAGERPGVPHAARRQWVFTDVETGEERGRTAPARRSRARMPA